MTQRQNRSSSTAQLNPDVAWRRGRLLAAGFAADLADRLAADRGVDLHTMLGLVDRGCPPELAWRILAPLNDEGRDGYRC
jgi:hypothetical protein